MNLIYRVKLISVLSVLLLACAVQAGKLAIVIDDLGYRPDQDIQVLQMPSAISVAVLPETPDSRQTAIKAHQQGHEVLIHLPMVPLSKQPLEKNTLHLTMSSAEIGHIIHQAVQNVPYAVGLNNHMGSAMTSNLPAMQKVMQQLEHYPLYFLDSMTTAKSQSSRAAIGTRVKVIKNRVFLDHDQNENAIRKQFALAVQLAQRNGSVIAIGHPHPTTIKVLQALLPMLPQNITLVRPSQLLDESPSINETWMVQKNRSRLLLPSINPCTNNHPTEIVPASHALQVIADSINESHMIKMLKRLF